MGRRRVEPRIWEDWYSPADYIGMACGIARKYCKAHPDADKPFVYEVATHAAVEYESGTIHNGFRLFIEVMIRTAIYKQEGRYVMITEELKAAMIAENQAGLSYGQIAIKHDMNAKTVGYHLTKWKKQSAALETPETPAAPETRPNQIRDEETESVENDVKVFKPGNEAEMKIVPIRALSGFAALLAMQEFVNAIAEGAEIVEAAAAGSDAHVSFRFGGSNYGLEMKRLDG